MDISDRKELKKRLLKLFKKSHPYIANNIIKKVLDSEKPRKAIMDFVDEYVPFQDIYPEVLTANGAGFVVVGGEDVYPVIVNYSDKDAEDPVTDTVNNFKWALMNQQEIYLAAAHACMNALDKTRLSCKVLMMSDSGYSGLVENIEIERGSARVSSVRVGQYFTNKPITGVKEG